MVLHNVFKHIHQLLAISLKKKTKNVPLIIDGHQNMRSPQKDNDMYLLLEATYKKYISFICSLYVKSFKHRNFFNYQ